MAFETYPHSSYQRFLPEHATGAAHHAADRGQGLVAPDPSLTTPRVYAPIPVRARGSYLPTPPSSRPSLGPSPASSTSTSASPRDAYVSPAWNAASLANASSAWQHGHLSSQSASDPYTPHPRSSGPTAWSPRQFTVRAQQGAGSSSTFQGHVAPCYTPTVPSTSDPATRPYFQEPHASSSGPVARLSGSHHVHPQLQARTAGGYLSPAAGRADGQFGPYAGILAQSSYAQPRQQEMPLQYAPAETQPSRGGPARKRKAVAEGGARKRAAVAQDGLDVVSAGPIAGPSHQPARVSRKATRAKRPAKARHPRIATKEVLRWAVDVHGYLIFPETPEEATRYFPTYEEDILKDLKPLDCCKKVTARDMLAHKGTDIHRLFWGERKHCYVPVLRKYRCGAEAIGCTSVFNRDDEVPRHQKFCKKYKKLMETGAGLTTAADANAPSTSTVAAEDMAPEASAIPSSSALPVAPSEVHEQQPYAEPSFWTGPAAQQELPELPSDEPPISTQPLAMSPPLFGPAPPLTIDPRLLANVPQQPPAVFAPDFGDNVPPEQQLPTMAPMSAAPAWASTLNEPVYTADPFTEEQWASAIERLEEQSGNPHPTDPPNFTVPDDAPPSDYGPWSSSTGAFDLF